MPWRLLAAGVATLLGLGTLATAAAAAAGSDTLTVTFRADPNAQCGTAPDVGGLTVPEGTPVQFLNRTGHDGSLVVGGEDEHLPRNTALQLTIAVGQYDVRLVEDCGSVAISQPVTLTVGGAAPTSASSTTTSAPVTTVPAGSRSSPPAGQQNANVVVVGQPTGSPAAGSPAPAVGVIDPTATHSGTASRSTGPNSSPVLAATAIPLDGPERNPKDVRLLALVATICVLGVTAAIIRSIVRLSP
jgi:hypothetical protein